MFVKKFLESVFCYKSLVLMLFVVVFVVDGDVVKKLKVVAVTTIDQHYFPSRNFGLALDLQIGSIPEANFSFEMLKMLPFFYLPYLSLSHF